MYLNGEKLPLYPVTPVLVNTPIVNLMVVFPMKTKTYTNFL